MDDLISRVAALKAVNAYDYRGFTVDMVKTITDGCAVELKKLPAVDAEPVRHGKWIKKIGCVKCSTCFEDCWADSAPSYEFCPYCGAKMDMEKEKE